MPLSEHAYRVSVAFKMTEWVQQRIGVKFCIKLEHSSVETIHMIQEATAMGNWWLAVSSWARTCSCITSCAEILAKHQITQVTQASYSPDLASWDFWLFPQTKITFESEEISDHQWDSGTYDGADDGFCGNCVRSQGAYIEGDWGIIVLGTMFLLSCIFFNKCLCISYYMTGYLLDRPYIYWPCYCCFIIAIFKHWKKTEIH